MRRALAGRLASLGASSRPSARPTLSLAHVGARPALTPAPLDPTPAGPPQKPMRPPVPGQGSCTWLQPPTIRAQDPSVTAACPPPPSVCDRAQGRGSMADTNDVTYHARIDFEAFRQIYLAQNRKYQRKPGIACAIIGAVLTVAGLSGLAGVGVSPETLAYAPLFVAIFVMGVVAISAPSLSSRRARPRSQLLHQPRRGRLGPRIPRDVRPRV